MISSAFAAAADSTQGLQDQDQSLLEADAVAAEDEATARIGALDVVYARLTGVDSPRQFSMAGPAAVSAGFAADMTSPFILQTAPRLTNVFQTAQAAPAPAPAAHAIATALKEKPVSVEASKPIVGSKSAGQIDNDAANRMRHVETARKAVGEAQGAKGPGGPGLTGVFGGTVMGAVAASLGAPPAVAQVVAAAADMSAVVGRGSFGVQNNSMTLSAPYDRAAGSSYAQSYIPDVPKPSAAFDTAGLGGRAFLAGSSLGGISGIKIGQPDGGGLNQTKADLDRMAVSTRETAQTLNTIARNGVVLGLDEASGLGSRISKDNVNASDRTVQVFQLNRRASGLGMSA